MTDVEDLLNLPRSVSELTDEELEQHLAQFFPHTRPAKPLPPVMKRSAAALTANLASTSTALTDAAEVQAQKLAAMFRKAGIDPVTRKPILVKKTGMSLKDLQKT